MFDCLFVRGLTPNFNTVLGYIPPVSPPNWHSWVFRLLPHLYQRWGTNGLQTQCPRPNCYRDLLLAPIGVQNSNPWIDSPVLYQMSSQGQLNTHVGVSKICDKFQPTFKLQMGRTIKNNMPLINWLGGWGGGGSGGGGTTCRGHSR